MAKTPINMSALTPAMITAAGSADTDVVHNYVLVNDNQGNLYHVEAHTGKYYTSNSLQTVAGAVTMLRNPATD